VWQPAGTRAVALSVDEFARLPAVAPGSAHKFLSLSAFDPSA
jgi:hypothetical protein